MTADVIKQQVPEMKLVHQGGNESIVVLLRGDCQIPDFGAKSRDLPIPGERITIYLFAPLCTSISLAFEEVIKFPILSLPNLGL